MFAVFVEESFAAAHFLPDYHGKCENLHGHNYKIRIHSSGKILDKSGMLVDFGVLKKALRSVLELLDHSLLNDHPYFKVIAPSAENIAQFVHIEMKKLLPNTDINKVEVFETEKNAAAYMPDTGTGR
jgi:6-pyruvoyltetrahydropterin/6-carboxytetrahydropterin synthase